MNEVKLIVQPPTGGCVFTEAKGPNGTPINGSYIYEMAVYKLKNDGSTWEEEPDENYTNLLNDYDQQQLRFYDSETGGFHLNKRTFKYEFDKSDETKIQEESIKVCIHVIDSCAWAANEALGTNKQDLYKIGVPTNEVIIAKYPTLKEQLEEIKKDITFKYKKGEAEAKDLPIGDECEKINGEEVFVEWGDEAKEALKEALKNHLL